MIGEWAGNRRRAVVNPAISEDVNMDSDVKVVCRLPCFLPI
jgi:hypothetical protein